MKQVLIGHRGTGKTTYLKNIKDINVFDLDQEIERRTGRQISEIFTCDGEFEFRKIEEKVFVALTKENHTFCISVGAGFFVERIPANIEKIWLCRDSDFNGRIFTDRPRLEKNMSPLQEYKKRFSERNIKFQKFSDWVLTLPEGDFDLEKFSIQGMKSDSIITVLPDYLKSGLALQHLIGLNVKYFEIRNDLLSSQQISRLFEVLPKDKILFSVRTMNDQVGHWINQSARSDYDISLQPKNPDISSIHCTGLFSQAIAKLGNDYNCAKVALKTDSIVEVKKGLDWQRQDPLRRNFLPISEDGRWAWVRLYLKNKQQLNFIREGSGTAMDQPTVWQWLNTPNDFNKFAAVLGSPIKHSYSPQFHNQFFAKRKMPFFAIQVNESEYEQYFPILIELGLVAAAVTSPLKSKISFNNTFVVQNNDLMTTNTDQLGLKELAKNISPQARVVVWGGGGVLPALQGVLSNATYYSCQQGKPREGFTEIESPDVFIWAANYNAKAPTLNWSPRLVIDLNYREDSLAKEYALAIGAKYINGLGMFVKQAQEQQKFWEKYL